MNNIVDTWKATTDIANVLRKYARQLNNALAIASVTAASEVVPRDGAWAPSVVICGKVYTRIGPLRNNAAGTARKFAQLWYHDPEHNNEDTTIDARLSHMPPSACHHA